MRSKTAALPFSRRQALAAGASLPLAAAAATLARPAHGAAEMMGTGRAAILPLRPWAGSR
jgi:hypothetical protein